MRVAFFVVAASRRCGWFSGEARGALSEGLRRQG